MIPEQGDLLLHYRMIERIGAGGMGVVWKALDTKLGREVAIKILPPEVSDDRGRLERFEQEARSLAALNHPNIAQVHGLEKDPSGVRFLALEWVPGEDLAVRIARGPVAPSDAVEIGRQIAAGLEAAHERGIVHRDLKPANVRRTPEGRVKLLDFGLAKIVEAPAPAADPSASPTVTSDATLAGAILGTAAYMSPEQARGGPVDRRTDIWAFGCVMFELLTGTSPFRGRTVPETLAAVLEREPDLAALPAATPRALVRLLRRCLRKNPRERLRDIGDAALELEECGNEPRPSFDGGTRTFPTIAWIALLIAAAIVGALLGTRIERHPAAATAASLSVVLPEGVLLDRGELPGIAVSPDGGRVAFVGREGSGTRLFVRSLDAFDTVALPETEGAIAPFFSSDGRWIGYQQGTTVWKVPVGGGAPARVGLVPPIARGFDWSSPDEIVVTWSKRSGLFGLSLEDGSSRTITSVAPEDNEVVHNWAQPLPGGQVLATVVGEDASSYDDGRILVLDPERGFKKTLVEGGYYGRLLTNDILVYVRGGTLYAVRVDRAGWEVTDPAVPVLDGFLTDPNTGSTWLDFSDDGVLVYAPGHAYQWQAGRLVWLARDGTVEPVLSQPMPYRFPRISPDGTRALLTIEAVHDDIWVYEFERQSLTRLTFEKRNVVPLWRPRSGEISFAAVGAGDRNPRLYSLAIDGRSRPSRLVDRYEGTLFCSSWSPDGETLAFVDWNEQQQFDILLSADGGTADPEPFLASRFDEHSAVFSPDGAWLAYVSNESGVFEVYVAPVAGAGGKRKVSPDGGVAPVWNPAGGELFYREGSRMMAVPVRTGTEVSVGSPRFLFDAPRDVGRLYWVTHYDVSPDGQRFLTVVREPTDASNEIRVVHDWFESVEAKLDTAEN